MVSVLDLSFDKVANFIKQERFELKDDINTPDEFKGGNDENGR